MLPFSKRKNPSEVELGEDDFELVEVLEPARSAQPALPRHGREHADEARTIQRARTIMPVSRRVLAEDVEEDVAGQCLASIAAETSRDAVDPYASSQIRAALARPHHAAHHAGDVSAPPSSSSAPVSISRLPSVTAPPFPGTTRTTPAVPGVRDSSPPPAFVRRSRSDLASASAIPPAAPSSYVAVAAAAASEDKPTASSVAPVSMPMTQRPNEPTVIVVRERPRASWIFAAAAIGALGSFCATRLLTVDPAPPVAAAAPPAAVAAVTQVAPQVAPLAAPPSSVVVAPPRPSAEPAEPRALPPAVVHFGDDEGVAIKAPAPAQAQPPRRPVAPPSAPAAPAAATVRSTGPRAPSMGPALPDGSFGLGRSDTTPSTPSATAPALPLTASASGAGVEPPRKHALTPEQQLAAAQLKASMK